MRARNQLLHTGRTELDEMGWDGQGHEGMRWGTMGWDGKERGRGRMEGGQNDGRKKNENEKNGIPT
jgi:hypothetical protein